jgi:hypothetical protein
MTTVNDTPILGIYNGKLCGAGAFLGDFVGFRRCVVEEIEAVCDLGVFLDVGIETVVGLHERIEGNPASGSFGAEESADDGLLGINGDTDDAHVVTGGLPLGDESDVSGAAGEGAVVEDIVDRAFAGWGHGAGHEISGNHAAFQMHEGGGPGVPHSAEGFVFGDEFLNVVRIDLDGVGNIKLSTFAQGVEDGGFSSASTARHGDDDRLLSRRNGLGPPHKETNQRGMEYLAGEFLA